MHKTGDFLNDFNGGILPRAIHDRVPYPVP